MKREVKCVDHTLNILVGKGEVRSRGQGDDQLFMAKPWALGKDWADDPEKNSSLRRRSSRYSAEQEKMKPSLACYCKSLKKGKELREKGRKQERHRWIVSGGLRRIQYCAIYLS